MYLGASGSSIRNRTKGTPRPRHQLQDRHDLSLKTLLRPVTTRLFKDHDALL